MLRHGESEGNVAAAEAHAAGSHVIAVPARDADVVLTQLGRDQAAAAGSALAELPPTDAPEVVLASPYVRALETAQIARSTAGLDIPLVVDERLRDRELGVLDRLTTAGVAARHPEEAERRRWQGKYYHRPAGGESWADVSLRLRSWMADLRHGFEGKRVMVVSHDVVVTLIRALCEGLDEATILELARTTPLRNASLSRLVRHGGAGWSVATYDEVEHLSRAGLEVTEHRGERHERG